MKKKILIIEKDEDVLGMVAHLLIEEGYDVISSSTEFGIFELVRRERPQVVLLDILKPTVQGASLSRAIKTAGGSGDITVISLSSHLNIPSGLKQDLDLIRLLQIINDEKRDKDRIVSR